MPWFRVDDNLGFHHKVIAAGNPAMGLWVRAGSVCASQLTDGFVADHMIASLGTVAQAKRLVDVGLWMRTEGGYRFHEWEERQPRRSDVEAERAAAKERMRAARERKRKLAQDASPQVDGVRSGDVRPNKSRSSGEVLETFGNPDPSLPDPSLPDPPKSVPDSATAPSAQVFVTEWLDHCDERPPSRVVGQVAKELKAMLDEGIAPERVRAALAEWNRKGLHPSTLPSVVHEMANKRPEERRTRVQEHLTLVQQLAAEEAAGKPVPQIGYRP